MAHNDKLVDRRFVLIRDIERNPYPLGVPENGAWSDKDDRRLLEVTNHRHRLYLRAQHLRFHRDPDVAELAQFYLFLFQEE